ncbi:hypothetical protein ACCT17_33690 [Rhizobium ruizarguesonis]
MFDLLISTATAGFGASLGRDLYKAAKKNPIVFGIIGALMLAFGWRNLFLGYGRSFAYFLFVTIIGSVVMILFGGVLLSMAAAICVDVFAEHNKVAAALAAAGAVVSISLVGILWGRRDRRNLVRRATVAAQNLKFLTETGFSESQFESDQMIDPEGHTLKLVEETEDRLVFSVVGRRGLRAAIRVKDGEMVSYTGVQKAA